MITSQNVTAPKPAYTNEVAIAHGALAQMGGIGADILRLHYLCSYSWEEVGARVDYSESHTRDMARDALLEYYDYMPLQERDPMYPAL